MATFWERAPHSVYRVFSLYFDFFVILVISHFGFEGGTLVLLASVPGHIRIYHDFVDRIENSVPSVTAWHHEALPSECMKIEMSKFTTKRQQFPMMFGTCKSSFYLNQRHLTMWSTSLQLSPICAILC